MQPSYVSRRVSDHSCLLPIVEVCVCVCARVCFAFLFAAPQHLWKHTRTTQATETRGLLSTAVLYV